MSCVYKHPFGALNTVIYSHELSKYFLDDSVTSILEVGCGIGVFAFRYASSHKNVSITGVDISAKTIEFLASTYGKYYNTLRLISCDFCEEGLVLDGVFDVVYSSDVIEHVTNTRVFVDNICQHLRVGGKSVVSFPNLTTHGINHFNEVGDVRNMFARFRDVKVFTVSIDHRGYRWYFAVRGLYESLFSRTTREERNRLNCEREEQGIDCFEDSTCFKFIKKKGKLVNLMAGIFVEAFLLIKPMINVREVASGNILNCPRLVVVAIK